MVVNHFGRGQIARMWRERRTSRDNRNQNNRRDSCYRPTVSVHAPTRARLRPRRASRKAARTHGSSRCGAGWYKALSRIAVRNTRRFACSRACCATIECTSSSRLLPGQVRRRRKRAPGCTPLRRSAHHSLCSGALSTCYGRLRPRASRDIIVPTGTSATEVDPAFVDGVGEKGRRRPPMPRTHPPYAPEYGAASSNRHAPGAVLTSWRASSSLRPTRSAMGRAGGAR